MPSLPKLRDLDSEVLPFFLRTQSHLDNALEPHTNKPHPKYTLLLTNGQIHIYRYLGICYHWGSNLGFFIGNSMLCCGTIKT